MEKTTKDLERSSKQEVRQMSDVADVTEARRLIQEAFPVTEYGNAKSAIGQAYQKLKLKTERRAKAIWNGEARTINNWEMTALEMAALKQARRTYARAEHRIETLIATLRVQDEDFHRDEIERLGD